MEKHLFEKGMMSMNAVEINGLTKFYGKSRGIVDLSLTVAEGEFYRAKRRRKKHNCPHSSRADKKQRRERKNLRYGYCGE